MAKQKGIIKIEGTIGDITFFKTQDGYLAREHAPVTADQIRNAPAFQRTRENMAEFGRAGKASQLLRTAIRPVLQQAKDSRITSRLTSAFSTVIKADEVNPRGRRNVIDGEATLLRGFNFNSNAPLGSTLYMAYTTAINRATGQCTVNMPQLVPANDIVAPQGCTHFSFMGMAAAIDFENETHEASLFETGMLPWDSSTVAAQVLTANLSPAGTHPIFLVFGIRFYQFVNGSHYPLKDGGFNALQVINVDGGV